MSQQTGTHIDVTLGASLPVDASTLDWAQRACLLAEGGESYKGKTSPHWYDGDSFFEVLQSAGMRPVRDVIGDFDGCTGPKAGQIAAPFLGRSAQTLTREDATALLWHVPAVMPASCGLSGWARWASIRLTCGVCSGHWHIHYQCGTWRPTRCGAVCGRGMD